MGLSGFIGWWVREIPVPLVAIAVAVWSYFPLTEALSERTLIGHQLDSLQASVVSGLAAFLAVFPLALTLARLLTAPAAIEFLTGRVLRGGLQTPQETLRRAKALGGHRPFGPPGGQS
jgi:hypothetical protein